jgi:hypothetical protein
LAEWLYEEGIGEDRAILVEDGHILEAAIELPEGPRFGTVLAGRLATILVPGRRGLVSTPEAWVFVEPLPPELTEGQKVRVEIVREPIAEQGNPKQARGRITDLDERPGPSLLERIGDCTRMRPTDADRFEQAGWSELIEEAVSGEIPFGGGELRMSLTPAMTLFDVDGALPPAELAMAGAAAAGRAIRRLGISGSIGIDLPTLASRAERQRAAAALDAALPQPFERTAVNGFGFLQIIRRRSRESLPEQLQFDSVGAAARALLRRAERVPGAGARLLTASPQVIARIESRPDWIARLRLVTGTAIRLHADPRRTTWSVDVQSVQSRQD